MSTTRTCINRYSLPTSVQWQFSGIPPPPQLLTPNLFHPSSGTGEFSGFGPCSGLGALPQDSKPNMPTTAIRLNVRVNSWTDFSGQMLTFDGIWHFGEMFSSRMNPGFHCTGQMADSVYGIVWVSGLLMSMLRIEWPMVAWGYGMGRRMLWTMNTGTFYWWHFECTEIPWRDPEAHCCAIHPRPCLHVAAW